MDLLISNAGISHYPELHFSELQRSGRKHQRKRGTERRTSQASVEAFERIKQRRSKLYGPILIIVSQHGPEPERCLTAREILRHLKAQGTLPADAERNDVSPRIFECFEAGCVENPADPTDSGKPFLKRTGSDATAMTWRITERGRLLIEHLRSREPRRN